jgi:thymidylate synthase (FAD)
MTVRLIGITQPRIDGVTSADELIAYTARVSNPANQMNSATASKLLTYLIENNHWSPFEMVSVTMEITTTRDISRQIIRHRSFSFQEFSQRYAKSEQFVTREARLQDKTNRQNSIAIDRDDEKQRRLAEDFRMKQVALQWQISEVYNWALDNGIAKEQARAVLAEGMTETTLYMAGTLRSWLHYIMLRAEKGTQLEHRQIAWIALEILLQEFPSLRGYMSDAVP